MVKLIAKTKVAKEWVINNVCYEDYQLGKERTNGIMGLLKKVLNTQPISVVIDRRYVEDIIDGINDSGLGCNKNFTVVQV